MPDAARDHRAVAEQLYARFSGGDIEAVLDLLDPAVAWELVGPAEIPYFGRRHGVAEVRRFFDLLSSLCMIERFEVGHITVTAAGAVAEGFERAHFVDPRHAYDMRWCHVMAVSDRRITSFTDYLDTAPVLAAWRSSGAAASRPQA